MTDAKMPVVSSRRPYLLRAMHEWMTDNQQTPHLVVDATANGVEVPRQFVQDGKIVLNISYHATNGLTLGNERVEFNARFSGQTHHVLVPIHAVLGIYARETGQGMIFSDEDAPHPTPPDTAPETGGAASSEGSAKPVKTRPQLKVVK
ncbi:MAG: ClpXP protease specificity-enhancing factor [Steroidobacteraceae bacterium]